MVGAWSTPLLGRVAELVRLRELLASAAAGRAHVALIAGPAGVGKSRLVAEFADSAGERVLVGACLPLGSQGVPFAPVVAMVRDLVSDPEYSAQLPTVFASVLPDANVSTEPMTPLAIYQGVLALLSTGGDAVTTIVIEDIHWADRSTLDLLSMLVTNVRDQRVLLVLTYRTDDVHRDHPLRPVVSELQRSPWVERIDVAPFNAAVVAEQIEALTGAPPSNVELAAAMDRTQGNPYFVEQLVAAGGLTDPQLPSSLRDMLLARTDVVSSDARRTLRIMSLADGAVDDESLAQVADRTLSEVRSHLHEALDMHLLAMTSDGVGFAHALVREALESDLLPGERIASHRAFADQLAAQLSGNAEQRADLLARLAHHCAAAGDIDEAVDAWRRAAAASERLGGYAEAVHHLALIIEHWNTVTAPERRVATSYESLLARAAECAFLSGDPARACHLATQAVALVDPTDDPGPAGVLHERLARYTNDLGDHARALALCEQAVQLVPAAPPSAERARVVAGLARQLMIQNRFAESRTRAIEAAELARTTGATVALANALNTLGVVESDLAGIEEGLVHMEEALRLAGETESADELLRAHWNTFGSLFNAGEFERAAEAFERVRTALPEIGQAHLLPELARTAAEVHFRLGDWARAQQIVDEFQTWFPHRADEVELIDMLVARGQFTAARATLRRISERRAYTDVDQQIFTIDTAAEIELWEGDLDAARLAIDEALAIGAGGEPRLATASALALGCRIEADAARRDRSVGRPGADTPVAARIEGYLGRIDSLLDQPGPERGWKCEARAFAALGRAEAARAAGLPACEAWGSATAAWRDLRTPYPAAYTEFRRAEALVESGDRDAATAVMRQAHAVAVGLGAEPLRTLIEAYARRVALAVDAPVDIVAPHGLTPRELEVVAILGHGATNRQIATAMYISEKTASVHVSNVMRKLGAANRSEVVAIAHREGLVTA